MKNNSTKSMKWLSVVVICLCFFNAAHAIAQGIGCMASPDDYKVVWLEDIRSLQIAILVGRMLWSVSFSILMLAFVFNSLKSLKNGTLFPGCNVGILYGSAAAFFLYRFCQSNMGIVFGEGRNILLNSDDLIVPLIITIFAIIYKLAVKVSMENSLTI